jgi:protein ImuB
VLRFVLERLTQDVQAALAARGWGARQLACRLQHESAQASRLEVSLFRPSQTFAHLWGLLRTRLEQARVVEPVTAMTLRVISGEPLAAVQAEFVDEDQTAARRELALLIDRLSSRLGREAVTRPLLVPDPQPEYACRFEPVIGAAKIEDRGSRIEDRRKARDRRSKTENRSSRAAIDIFDPRSSTLDSRSSPTRPLSLSPRPSPIEVMRVVPGGLPARFRWQGQDFHVIRVWGPERIDTGWWRGHDIQRDYYVVSTEAGTRFWLFHSRDEESWFLHGCFD